MDYIHYNAIKHGYVNSPTDWAQSTFMREVKNGRYGLHWADGNFHELEFGERSIMNK